MCDATDGVYYGQLYHEHHYEPEIEQLFVDIGQIDSLIRLSEF